MDVRHKIVHVWNLDTPVLTGFSVIDKEPTIHWRLDISEPDKFVVKDFYSNKYSTLPESYIESLKAFYESKKLKVMMGSYKNNESEGLNFLK